LSTHVCLVNLHFLQGIGSNATVTSDASKSIAVSFGADVIPIAISVGSFHTCAIANGPGKTKGNLYCWGLNDWGRLGIPAEQVYDCITRSCDVLVCMILGKTFKI
jgi:alpha-tubulin suppressor-like RCC1 family protein